MDMTKIIVARLDAAKDRLLAKGYECPSVEIGGKVLGNYGPVFWATIHLGSPTNHVRGWTQDTLEQALDAIDASEALIPTFDATERAKKLALEKLTPDERKLLDIRQ